MRYALVILASAVTLTASPALAEVCNAPAVVTGGEAGNYAHAAAVTREAQPVRRVSLAGGRGLGVRGAGATATTPAGGLAIAQCHGCCKPSSPRAALAATPSMKDCAHACGCPRERRR